MNNYQRMKISKQYLHIHNIYVAWSTVQHIIVKFFWWGRRKPLFSMFHGWKHAVFSFIRKISLLTHIADHLWTNGRNRAALHRACFKWKKMECTRVQPVRPFGQTLQYFCSSICKPQFMELFWINITTRKEQYYWCCIAMLPALEPLC